MENRAAYNIEMFETHGSAAPRRQPDQREPAERLRRVPRSHRRAKPLSAADRLRAGLIVALAVLTVFMGYVHLSAGAESYRLNSEIRKKEALLQEKLDENTRLNVQLNERKTADKVAYYATNVLGMVKAENGQTEYVDLSDGDVVLFAGGRALR